MRKTIITIFGVLFATMLYGATVQTPNAVRITNDGYNNVTNTTSGSKRGLDVNISSAGTVTIGVQGNKSVPDNAAASTSSIDVNAHLVAYDAVSSGNYFRLLAYPTNGDGQAVNASPRALLSSAYGYGFNGTTWDRLRSTNTGQLISTLYSAAGVAAAYEPSNVDAVATTGSFNRRSSNSQLYGYNGTTWDRLRSVNTGQLVITQKNSSGTEKLLGEHGESVTILYEHNQTHLGENYLLSSYVTITASNNYDFLITTPTTTEIHLHYDLDVDAEAYSTLYEGPNASGGTAATPINRNRTSANTTSLTITTLPTVTTTGTQLRAAALSTTKKVGGDLETDEFILQANTKYLLRIIAGAGSAVVLNYDIHYYED